jgi:N4-gp56 family major capsid protein
MDTTTSSLSGLMSIFYSRDFLDRANQIKVYDIGAQKRPMPSGSGKTVYFNRFSQLAAATTPLTESTSPTATSLTTTVVSATVAEYGAYGTVSSLYDLTNIDAGLREHVAVFAEQGALTIDTLIKTELASGATAQLAGGKSNITAVATSDVLSGAEIRKAVKTLKKNGAHRFEDGYFKAIVPVTAVYDLMGNSEWLDAHRYTDASNIQNGEIGRLHGVTFHETNNEATTASTTTVYSTYVFGKNAYGVVDINSSSNVEIIVKKSGAGDTANPLNMYSTIGWKVNAFVVKTLNSNWLIAIKSGTQS